MVYTHVSRKHFKNIKEYIHAVLDWSGSRFSIIFMKDSQRSAVIYLLTVHEKILHHIHIMQYIVVIMLISTCHLSYPSYLQRFALAVFSYALPPYCNPLKYITQIASTFWEKDQKIQIMYVS